MTCFLPNFDGYDNPRRARALWEDYSGDLERYGIENKARDIAADCNQIIDLDIRLERLISKRENRFGKRH